MAVTLQALRERVIARLQAPEFLPDAVVADAIESAILAADMTITLALFGPTESMVDEALREIEIAELERWYSLS